MFPVPRQARRLTLALLLAMFGSGAAQAASGPPQNLIADLKAYTQSRFPFKEFDDFIFVSVSRQRLFRIRDWVILRSYPVSTASRGTGSSAGSLQTPLGLHRICRKFGDGVPLGGILKGRRYRGQVAEILNDPIDIDEDHVTTRGLWLCGLEPGLNQGEGIDSFERYIYIHGTPEEGLIGRPASDGCVRMHNRSVIELYDATPLDRLVLILDQ